jgi:hypothetical protein
MHATSIARHHRPSVVCRKRAIPLADSSVVRADPANTRTYILEHTVAALLAFDRTRAYYSCATRCNA